MKNRLWGFFKTQSPILLVWRTALLLYVYVASRASLLGDASHYAFRALGWFDYIGFGQAGPTEWFGHTQWWTGLAFQDHPPLVFAIEHIFFKLFGDTTFIALLPFVLAGVATSVVIYYFVSQLRDTETAFFASLLILVSSFMLGSTTNGFLEGIEVLFITFTFLNFTLYDKTNLPKYLYAGSFGLGLALLSKYTALFIIPSFLLVLFARSCLRESSEPVKTKAFVYAAVSLLLSTLLSGSPEFLFASLNALILISYLHYRQQKYLYTALVLGALWFISAHTATTAVIPVFWFMLFNRMSIRKVYQQIKLHAREYRRASILLACLLAPIAIYNYHLWAQLHIFQQTLASIVGTTNVFGTTANTNIIFNATAVMRVFFDQGSFPFVLISLTALAWLGVERYFKRFDALTYGLTTYSFFLLCMFCFMGSASDRYMPIVIPFLAVALAVTIVEFKNRYRSLWVTSALLVILGFEAFYAVNTHLIPQPIGKVGIFYSPYRVESGDFAQLDTYLQTVLSPFTPLHAPTTKEAVEALSSTSTLERKPQKIVLYDRRFLWFPSWWYLERYRTYYQVPVYPTGSQAQEVLLPHYTLNSNQILNYHPTVYFIYTLHTKTRDRSKPNYVSVDTFAELLEQKNTPFELFANNRGEPSFKVYKIQL